MDKPIVRRRKISDYAPDQRNANRGTERGQAMLDRSVEQFGLARSIVAAADGTIPAGNKTLQAAADAGIEDVIEIETDGHALVVVKRTDWANADDEAARGYAYYDNRVPQVDIRWEPVQIATDLAEGVNLSGLFSDGELTALLKGLPPMPGSEPEGDESADPLAEYMPPLDLMWASDNEFDVPMLDLSMQAIAPVLPIVTYGSMNRRAGMGGTYHFYTDDYRFRPLWEHPETVLEGGAAVCVEPNFTMGPHTPRAMALWLIFQKRWIARYWQSNGVRIFVDLNTNPRWHDIDLLGVPQGWKAYATRGYIERIEGTLAEYEHAVERAGGPEGLVFLVYGGGKAIEAECKARGWLHAYEHMDVKPHKVKAGDNGKG